MHAAKILILPVESLMKTTFPLVFVASLLFAAPAFAAQPRSNQPGFYPQQLFFGGGLSLNSESNSDTALGAQIFGGYDFGQVAPNIGIDAEVGYMDSGSLKTHVDTPFGRVYASGHARGLWAAGVGRLALNPDFDLLGRLGYDFGDDDGLLFGVGVGYNMSRQTQLRLELVERNNITSVQFNVRFKP